MRWRLIGRLKVLGSSRAMCNKNKTVMTNNGIRAAIQLEIRVLAGWEARESFNRAPCRSFARSLVRSHARLLAPNAHAHALRSTLARIRTCTHLDQWPADHPTRKTSRKTLAVRPTKIDRRCSSLVIRPDAKEPVDHSVLVSRRYSVQCLSHSVRAGRVSVFRNVRLRPPRGKGFCDLIFIILANFCQVIVIQISP